MAGEALDLFSGLDQLRHLRIVLAHGAKLPIRLQRFFDGHVQLIGNKLGNRINLRVGKPHGSADISDGAPRQHGAEGDNLCHMIGAVLAHHIVNDLRTALVAEIDIEIRHGNALRIEEALKQQVILHRVDIGDADAVGGNTARTGATPRSDRYAVAFGIMNKIVDNEIVFDIPHTADGGKLIFQSVAVCLRRVFAIVPKKSFMAHAAEVAFVILAVRCIEQRQLRMPELELDIAALGDLYGIFDGLRNIFEKLRHFITAFDIELLCGEFQRLLIVDSVTGLNAGKQELHSAVLFGKVVGVVGSNQPHADLSGKADQVRQDTLLLLDAMVLQLNKIVLRAEQIAIPQGGFPCFFVFSGFQMARDLARQTRRKTDKTLVVVF